MKLNTRQASRCKTKQLQITLNQEKKDNMQIRGKGMILKISTWGFGEPLTPMDDD